MGSDWCTFGAVVGAVAFRFHFPAIECFLAGGKIEASLLRPISFGVAAVIAALFSAFDLR